MIGKLKGQVDSCFEDHAIIDVKGIGYLVFCSAKSLHKLVKNNPCQLFIETHVREDHIHLYGFITMEEKDCFSLLQTVNGIGPRMALSILSHLSPIEIGNAIAIKDKEVFRAVSGVGPKMAERILIELKDKLISTSIIYNIPNNANLNLSNMANDAISALVSLGINKLEAQNSVAIILNSKPEISINDLIRLALKERTQR